VKLLLLADGRAVHTVRYQKQLIDFGADVTLASLERGDTVDIQLKKKSVSRSLYYAYANREIKELVRKLNPDIVNPHFASAYGFSVALSRVWKRKPIALHCLGSDILISPRKSIAHRRKVMYALSKTSLVFTDSTYVANMVQSLHPVEKSCVIPWGVEPELLNIFKKKKTADFNKSRPLSVLCPRPLSKIYNNNFILDSLEELIQKKQIKLTFCLRGDDVDKFRGMVQKRFSENMVTFYDFKPREEYIKFIADFDIYMSASLSDSSPASLIEAIAVGMYPVVGDIPGLSDWIDSSNASLFNLKSKQSLRDTINQLLNDPINIGSVLKSNHEKVLEKGLFENNIKDTIQAMENLIRNAG